MSELQSPFECLTSKGETYGGAAYANEDANNQHIVRCGIEDVFGSISQRIILLGNTLGHGKYVLDKLVGNRNRSESDKDRDNERHWDEGDMGDQGDNQID